MLNDPDLRECTTILLRRCHDSQRLVQKFAFGKGDHDDLLALASTINASADLVATLRRDSKDEDECIRAMASRMNLEGPTSLAKRVKQAIDEDGVVHQHRLEDEEAGAMQALAEDIVVSEGSKEDANILPKSSGRKTKPTGIRNYYSDDSAPWIMKAGASSTLQHLHRDLISLDEEKAALEKSLSKRYSLTTLSLRFTPGLGHICHLKGKDTNVDISDPALNPSSFRSVRSSKSTRSFHQAEWTSLGQRIDQCKFRIRVEEQIVFNDLRKEVIANIVKLRRNATVLDELDIACSFATLAAERDWTRPLLNTSTSHKIVGGRHPTVEGGLEEEGRTFVSNDCFVGDTHKTWLITGPNMAGKSTFLRQNAVIVILAQVGSYVPAQYAELGIVDQLFSRVGSADNLYRDQSTFMVEMMETAAILRNATSRSFVIMDEIGRGTTPDDGSAVAFACLWYLGRVNRCRTLFATHFHILADTVSRRGLEGVGFYCTDVEEDEKGSFRYVHRLREGVNRRSHALKVARLAGLPEEAIGVAKEILDAEGREVGVGGWPGKG
jgi:DNA mismatch repair ATPase MutS